MEYENDYQFFDVIESNSFPQFSLVPNSEHLVYVRKDMYDKQVECGQETDCKTRYQTSIDTPRSHIRIDGEKVEMFPECVTTNIARYCTQTVMGMPVELLTQLGIVAERLRPHKLKVEVWGENVFAKKRLRILNMDEKWMPIEVQVNANMLDPCVTLKILTGSVDYTSALW